MNLGLQLCVRTSILAPLCLLLAHNPSVADGQLEVTRQGTNAFLKIFGSSNDDWLIESSDDFLTWSQSSEMPALLSRRTNPPQRLLQGDIESQFYRARKTGGLFDAELVRTIHLTFGQTNWQSLLDKGHTTGSNTLCTLSMDNGATNAGVGARYRGYSSYDPRAKKKSLNLEINFQDAGSDLMRYETINLNNASRDQTLLREILYFHLMRLYIPCPRAALSQLFINGENWGVYTLVQQEDGELIKEWFPGNKGDRWRTPNISTGASALGWLGSAITNYFKYYELKTNNSTNAYEKLVHAIDVLTHTPSEELAEKLDNVLAVDRWLWFLALENIFGDFDSYLTKGADYSLYYEPESGRLHPLERDGNEAFFSSDPPWIPLQGNNELSRPLLLRIFQVLELRGRYLAHYKAILQHTFRPDVITPLIDHYHALSVSSIQGDPKKDFTMQAYTNAIIGLKTFVTNRHAFLTNHITLKPPAPRIFQVRPSKTTPLTTEIPLISAQVEATDTNGLDSVWLYFRNKPYGRFSKVRMSDDGLNGDDQAGDSVYSATTTNYPAGSLVHFYIEATSAHLRRPAAFAPEKAEIETYTYQVASNPIGTTDVLINELMASNTKTIRDPQGDFDDWIELYNPTDQSLDLSDCFLTDDESNLRKWPFPSGTILSPGGLLVVWADEDGADSPGLHASFKLSANGEEIILVDRDGTTILDRVSFGPQLPDSSYGRKAADPGLFVSLPPTPGTPNF